MQKFFPKKKLGQNFLIDLRVRGKIFDVCQIKREDTVVEIGAGKGELTSMLAQAAGKVYAVELDRRLNSVLKDRLSFYPNAEVIQQDILKIDLALLKRDGPLKIIGNIPYYISTPLIEMLIRQRSVVGQIFIMVQKEYALRLAASPGPDLGSLSYFAQYYFEPKILFNIPRGCFYPAPKVDSVFLSLAVRSTPPVDVADEEEMFRLIRKAFQQRRKVLTNSLKGCADKGSFEAFLKERNLSVLARPQELSLEDFAALQNFLKKY